MWKLKNKHSERQALVSRLQLLASYEDNFALRTQKKEITIKWCEPFVCLVPGFLFLRLPYGGFVPREWPRQLQKTYLSLANQVTRKWEFHFHFILSWPLGYQIILVNHELLKNILVPGRDASAIALTLFTIYVCSQFSQQSLCALHSKKNPTTVKRLRRFSVNLKQGCNTRSPS